MSNYFTHPYKKSYERYATLNYFPTLNPVQSLSFKSYASTNSYDKRVESSLEPTELIYYETNYPTNYETNYPTIIPNSTSNLNYTCICKTELREYENKIIILIVATSLTSFTCLLLILFIIWYRFIFKRKLMNNSQNNKLFLEKFGVGLHDLNYI
jgi:hypothetical protein